MTEEEKRPQEVPQKRRRFYLRGASLIAITVLIITLFTGGIAYGVQSLTAEAMAEPVAGVLVDGVREFRISVRQWYYDPKIIKVNPGDTVRFILNSTGVTHGFALNEMGINLAIPPGEEVIHEVMIPPDMAEGIYTLYCSVFCGMGHPYLKGKIVVGTPILFLGVGMGKILPYIATSVMAGMFVAFIIIGRRRVG